MEGLISRDSWHKKYEKQNDTRPDEHMRKRKSDYKLDRNRSAVTSHGEPEREVLDGRRAGLAPDGLQ